MMGKRITKGRGRKLSSEFHFVKMFLSLTIAWLSTTLAAEDTLDIKGSISAGVPYRVTSMRQWEEVQDYDGYQVAMVAFVSDGCGHCKVFNPDWVTAANSSKGRLLFVEIDVDAAAMKKMTDNMQVATTPTVKICRAGLQCVNVEKGQREWADAFKLLVKQLTYKNSLMITTPEHAEFAIAEAYKVPKNEKDTFDESQITSYIFTAVQDKKEMGAFKEVAAYAMEQGDTAVKYVLCSKEAWQACGLKGGQARIARYDLPTAHNKTGIMHRKPLTDVRAFHIFSRGASLPPFIELVSTTPVAHYNAATIPVAFVVYNFGAGEKGAEAKEAKMEKALDYHDIADEEDLRDLGWEFMGRASIVQVNTAFLRKEFKHFETKFTKEDESDTRPLVYICKFVTSTTCYKLDARFDMSAGLKSFGGEDMMDIDEDDNDNDDDDDDGGGGDGDDDDDDGEGDDGINFDLGIKYELNKATIANFINSYLTGGLKFEPRSEGHDLYDGVNAAAQEVADAGSSTGRDGPNAHQKLVGLTYLDWIEDPDLWNVPRVTFLTHEECETCKQLEGMFTSLAKVASQHTPAVIRFATMDCSKNDAPDNIEIHNYPKFVYYGPKGLTPLNMRPSELYPHVKKLLKEEHGVDLAYAGDAEEGKEKKLAQARRKKRIAKKVAEKKRREEGYATAVEAAQAEKAAKEEAAAEAAAAAAEDAAAAAAATAAAAAAKKKAEEDAFTLDEFALNDEDEAEQEASKAEKKAAEKAAKDRKRRSSEF